MKKQQNKTPFYKKYRILTITLVMFLVILPIIFIPSIYITHFASSKDVLFGEKKQKAVSYNSQDKFQIEADLVEIVKYDQANNKDGKYIFDIDFTILASNVKVSTVEAQLSVKNDKYDTDVVKKNITSNSKTRFEIKFNYNMDKKVMPFVKPQGPTLYLKVTYTFTTELSSGAQTLIIKVPYPIPNK